MPHGFFKAHVKCGVAQIGPQQKAPSVHAPQQPKTHIHTHGKVSYQALVIMMIHFYCLMSLYLLQHYAR